MSTGKVSANAENSGAIPVKTGLYVDAGSRGIGIVSWARILTYSPQVELHLLDGDDLCNGKLDGLELLVMPGGSGFDQYNSMKAQGAEAVREFVRKGGKYMGTCAGLAIALNEPDRIQLIKYRRIIGAMRGAGMLAVQVSQTGASLLGIDPGRYMVRYSNGPLPQLTDQPGEGDSEVIATYDSTLGAPGSEGCSMYGLPAMIHGTYGKGKLLVTGFHPECCVSTLGFTLGCLFYLTGCKFTTEFPVKNYRPVRVSYYSTGLCNKAGTENALAIDASPVVDLTSVSEKDFDAGALDHADVLVLPGGDPAFYDRSLGDRHFDMIKNFIGRGGFVVTAGCTTSLVPSGERHFVCRKDKRILDVILEQINPE